MIKLLPLLNMEFCVIIQVSFDFGRRYFEYNYARGVLNNWCIVLVGPVCGNQ